MVEKLVGLMLVAVQRYVGGHMISGFETLLHPTPPHPSHIHSGCLFRFYFSNFLLREEVSESRLALFFISYQWFQLISDWSFEMLAWWTLPLEIHWRYGCWRIYSSCTLCEASKGWCTMYYALLLCAWSHRSSFPCVSATTCSSS